MLAFGVLLFGVALAHGASAETAQGHVVTSAVSVPGTSEAAPQADVPRVDVQRADVQRIDVQQTNVQQADVQRVEARDGGGAQQGDALRAETPGARVPDSGTGTTASLGKADDRHGSPGPAHPGEQCASGQPVQGSASAPPCLAPSVGRLDASGQRPAGRGSGGAEGAVTSSAGLKSSVVQQV
ncbi:hypothetical protein [Streptomyces longispororuber]|uniref:hypothetical protein n=1 Tax=Streptomyces longispororuber TaxID=68230 RepID=UPI0036FC1DAD